MPIYKVKLTYNSPTATGWDDETTITVDGTLEELQEACASFYNKMGIGAHDRYGSDQVTEDGRPADLIVNIDCAIAKWWSGSVVLPSKSTLNAEQSSAHLGM